MLRPVRFAASGLAFILLVSACGHQSSTPVSEVIDELPSSDLVHVTEEPAPASSKPVSSATGNQTDGGSDRGTDASATTDGSAPEVTTVAPTEEPTTTVKPRRLYEVLPAPILPTDHTPPFPKSGPLPDATYWAMYNGGDETTADVTLYRAYFGSECVAKAAAAGDECVNGIYVPSTPTRRLASVEFKSDVTITVTDAATQKSHYVTIAELVKIQTGKPSAGAPKGFAYTPFAYLMRIRSGKIARFRQVWTP